MSSAHCWKDYTEHLEDTYGWGTPEYWAAWGATWLDENTHLGRTCMLPDGHDGPHEWTLDRDFGVRFMDEPPTRPEPLYPLARAPRLVGEGR